MVDPNIKGQPQGIAPTDKTVDDIIGVFKSITTNEYIKNVKSDDWKRFKSKLWQRNYREHIIRNEKAHQNIAEYIVNNPTKWEGDKLFSLNKNC